VIAASFDTVHQPMNMVGFTAMLALLVAILWFGVPASLRGVDRFLGDITYPLYASHFLVCAIVGAMMPQATALATDAARLPACLAAAYLVNRWIERPLYPLRDRFRGVPRGPQL
jgi:peptidoglycan/LPS O-acetylase OafA/YrhL